MISCSSDYFIGVYCRYLYLNCLSDGEVLVKPFKFTNDNDGFCTLLSALASYDRGSLIIGLKSTAHYADNLVEGRNHYNALGHCAGKLVRILFKMLTDDVTFNLE